MLPPCDHTMIPFPWGSIATLGFPASVSLVSINLEAPQPTPRTKLLAQRLLCPLSCNSQMATASPFAPVATCGQLTPDAFSIIAGVPQPCPACGGGGRGPGIATSTSWDGVPSPTAFTALT